MDLLDNARAFALQNLDRSQALFPRSEVLRASPFELRAGCLRQRWRIPASPRTSTCGLPPSAPNQITFLLPHLPRALASDSNDRGLNRRPTRR